MPKCELAMVGAVAENRGYYERNSEQGNDVAGPVFSKQEPGPGEEAGLHKRKERPGRPEAKAKDVLGCRPVKSRNEFCV